MGRFVPVLLLLLPLDAGPAAAQSSAYAACVAEARAAADRVRSCTIALRSRITARERAQALHGRAAARMLMVVERLDAPGSVPPPPSDFDEAVADVLGSLDIAPSGEAVALLALLRLWRGELGDAGRQAVFSKDDEAVVAAMTAAIAAEPGRWEFYVARGASRALIGEAGSDEDFATARRLLSRR